MYCYISDRKLGKYWYVIDEFMMVKMPTTNVHQ